MRGAIRTVIMGIGIPVLDDRVNGTEDDCSTETDPELLLARPVPLLLR